MISDAELATAIAGRPHWQPTGPASAIYTPPDTPSGPLAGSAVSVRVQRVHQPTKREEFVASVIHDGIAAHARPFSTAAHAVTWAERVRPPTR